MHTWDFSNSGEDERLHKLGVQTEGVELSSLEEDEGIIRSSDYLEARVPQDRWRKFKNKYNNLFRRRLKEAKIADTDATKRPMYICRMFGGLRIVYTRNDIVIMDKVFEECQGNFESIAERDRRATCRRTLITDYARSSDSQETELQEIADDWL